MKITVTLLGLAVGIAAMGGFPGPRSPLPLALATAQAAEGSFSGTFTGQVGNTQAVVDLDRDDDEIYGEILADGYLYLLIATKVGQGMAQGEVYDPQTDSTMPAEITQQGDQLSITLMANGQPVAFQFTRGTTAPSTAAPSTAAPSGAASPEPAAAVPEGGRDGALVGVWSYQDVMTGGGMSVATVLYMQVGADGRYRYGDARTMASGADFGGDTGTGGATTGAWRTENNVIYVQQDGAAQWTPYARYEVSGNRLLLMFNDGSRQLWYRQ